MELPIWPLRMLDRSVRKWSRVHARNFPVFFLTRVVVQNVVHVIEGYLTPKGFPWVRTCTTGFTPFFRVCWPVMTLPAGLKKNYIYKKKKIIIIFFFFFLEKIREKSKGNCFITWCTEKQVADISNVVVWKSTGKCSFITSYTRKTCNESISNVVVCAISNMIFPMSDNYFRKRLIVIHCF